MNFFATLNEWILANQALVISAGVPLFTLVVTGWASFLSHRAKVSEVRLNGRVKLSEYRRNNYDELLKLSSRLQTLFIKAASHHLSTSTGHLNIDLAARLATVECINEFLLRSQASRDQTSQLSKCFELCTQHYFNNVQVVEPTVNLLGALRLYCKEILDDEWKRIVKELEGVSP